MRTLSRHKGGTQLQIAKFEDLALKGCSAQPGNSWQQSLHLNGFEKLRMPIGCKIDELLRKDSINASSKRRPPALAALGNIALTCSTGTYKHLIAKFYF